MHAHERAHAVVIDSNVLRKKKTIERLAGNQHAGGPAIAIPEIAFFEMTKSADRWETTVRRSLHEVARFPEAVVLTTAVKPLGVVEHRAGQPTASVISPRTEPFRQVLRDLAAGSGDALDAFLASVQARRKELEHASHAADSLATMQRLDKIASPVTDRRERAGISEDLALGNRDSFRKFAIEALPRSTHQASLAKIGLGARAHRLLGRRVLLRGRRSVGGHPRPWNSDLAGLREVVLPPRARPPVEGRLALVGRCPRFWTTRIVEGGASVLGGAGLSDTAAVVRGHVVGKAKSGPVHPSRFGSARAFSTRI